MDGTAENDIAQDMAEHAYRVNQIDAMEFRRRMYAIGFTPETCDQILDEIDRMEPEYLAQTAELKTGDERRSWVKARYDEAKAQGMRHGRVSFDEANNLLLVEAWKVRPRNEGAPRWQLCADGQLGETRDNG